MESAKDRIRSTLNEVKANLDHAASRRLSEADTKANFIEPLIRALGWSGIGVVTREYRVKNSGEFIDYVMFGPADNLLLAIEAKGFQAPLADKNAAQLIQYCSVEGIEWAALTNGRDLQFFNTFLKHGLEAKRLFTIDLLAFDTEAEFDALFEMIWLLSRESLTSPSGTRAWLNRWRLDNELRAMLLIPESPTIRQLIKSLEDADVRVTPEGLARWFESRLRTPPKPPPNGKGAGPTGEALSAKLQQEIISRWPDTRWRATNDYIAGESAGQTFIAYRVRRNWLFVGLALPLGAADARLSPNDGQFNWKRITKVLRIQDANDIDDGLLSLVGRARSHALGTERSTKYFGVSLRDLIGTGLINPETRLSLRAGGREVATATLQDDGQILWNGKSYRSPSDRVFAPLVGPTRTTLNGWARWHAPTETGSEPLSSIRERYLSRQTVAGETSSEN